MIFFAAAVLSGSHATVFPETLSQITLRGKSGKMSDIRDFMVCILQEIFAYFDPAVGQIADRLHISQISTKRIKHPGAVLKEGQEVRVKIISTANNKISLSMKELIEEEEEREAEDTYGYKEEGQASTGLADLLKGLKL